ncbi:MAG: CotH kinase family protein [Verrucomicrobia bacterium]|nr:CotH kinase family protein [Verrucomicrobiota bacterium]
MQNLFTECNRIIRVLRIGLAPVILFGIGWAQSSAAPIVINEILYHAPNDRENLEYVELHNDSDQPVDIGGFTFTDGIQFTFPPTSTIEARGYMVICKNESVFKEFYRQAPFGAFIGALKNGGERIELADASGRLVDSITYSDRSPWPVAADGEGASLERISARSPSDMPQNWAASGFSDDPSRPHGTPGRPNVNASANPPPVIKNTSFSPPFPRPGEPIRITTSVTDSDALNTVRVVYRVARSGDPGVEVSLPMVAQSEDGYSAIIPGQETGSLVRFHIEAIDGSGAKRLHPSETDIRPDFSCYVPSALDIGRIPTGHLIHTDPQIFATRHGGPSRRLRQRITQDAPSPPLPARGTSAFVYTDPVSRESKLFDYVHITDRPRGFKIGFRKDNPLNGMTKINLIFEQSERFVPAEYLAYKLYRMAGNAAELSELIRIQMDDALLGYHLLVEQPNRAFLRRNDLNDEGDLYKLLHYERGAVRQHEKKTRIHTGHQDLLDLLDALNSTRGDRQWEIIRQHFDVDQVVNYFAVNMVLSHWDGFFNNYFTYHDTRGSGKWLMFPWDQDKTWGYHDGLPDGKVFYEMPITYGMNEDRPPASLFAIARLLSDSPGYHIWWREPGHFSGPLLSNSRFRERFLARTKEILETIYTEEVFYPIIDQLGNLLREEVRIRASASGANRDDASRRLAVNLSALKDHLAKRRGFLLRQPEILKARAHR